jgi:hypothetical protein
LEFLSLAAVMLNVQWWLSQELCVVSKIMARLPSQEFLCVTWRSNARYSKWDFLDFPLIPGKSFH